MWQFDHATKQQVSYKIYVGVQSHIQALLKKERNKNDVRVCERRENSVVSGATYRLLGPLQNKTYQDASLPINCR